MIIIIAPAKRMRNDIAYIKARQTPALLKQTAVLRDSLKCCSPIQLQHILQCNATIARQAYDAYQHMNLTKQVVPALLAYDGIQYTYMAPHIFPDEYYEYVERHVRILSGFYGVLRPFDGVVPYRLELHDVIPMEGVQDLYAFWKDVPYQQVTKKDHELLDLASVQYSNMIKRYLQPQDRMVRCRFMEEEHVRFREKGVYVKMARGEMVRYLATIQATSIEEAKGFTQLGYHFDETRSNENTFVFVRKAQQ